MNCLITSKKIFFFNIKNFNLLIVFFLLIQQSKTTHAQTFAWAKQLGGANATTSSSYVGTDINGNILTMVGFTGIVDFDPGPAVYNLNSINGGFVIEKISAVGNFISAGQLNLPIRQAALDINGNILITGSFSGTVDMDPGPGIYNLTSAGYQDISVVKLDATGNFLWAGRMGGEGVDEGNNIAVNSTGNVYITGTFGYIGNTTLSPTADFDPDPNSSYILTSSGARDGFICCLNSDGTFSWAQKQPVSLMHIDQSDNVFLLGAVGFTTVPVNTTYISKINASGTGIWTKQVANTRLDMTGITANNAGEVLFSGGFSGNIYMGVHNIVSTSGQDPFFARLDNSGNVAWAKSIGGNGFAQHITYASDNNILLTGYFTGTGNVDFDPGPGVFNLNCKGNIAAFIEKVSGTGNFIWVKQIGGEAKSNTRGQRITTTSNGDIYTSIFFTATVDFDPNAPKYNLKSKGQWDVVVHKMTQAGNGNRAVPDLIVSEVSAISLSVYPNPAYNQITVQNSNNKILGSMIIYDVLGKIVYQKFIGNSKMVMEVKNFPSGVYYLRSDQMENAIKFVKQ